MVNKVRVLAVLGAVVVLTIPGLTAASAALTVKPQVSKDFAGYEVSKPSSPLNVATASFVVPKITCKKHLSGVGPSVVVDSVPNKQNIYASEVAAVGVSCENLQPTYESIIQITTKAKSQQDTAYNDFPFSAGDKVVMTVATNKSKTKITVDDVTTGTKKVRTGSGRVGTTAFIGDEGLIVNGKKTGLDPFAKTAFTAVEVNGKSLLHERAVPFEAKRGKTLLIAVSKLNKDGKGFFLTYKHS